MTVTTIHINIVDDSLEPLVDSLAAHGLPADARMVYYGPRNTVVAVGTDEGYVIVKAYKVPIWINKIAYGLLRPSKASRAFNNAMRLLSMGFETPEPIAYAEQRTFGMFGRSYYFCRHINGVREVRDIERLPECKTMLRELAELMVRLHKAGVLVKDFSPGNVLYRTDHEGKRHYMLVDINRMRFDVHEREEQMAMFARLLNTEELTAELAREYCRASGIAEAEAFVADAVKEYRAFWRRRKRKQAN